MRESAQTKAVRLLTEARLAVIHVTRNRVRAACRGDSGHVYKLGYEFGTWHCNCECRTDQCSHLKALRRVIAVEWTR